MTERDPLILAARRRGATQLAIANSLGITHQAVSQRLKKYEAVQVRVKRLPRAGRRPFVCQVCSKLLWLEPYETREFCGLKCSGLAIRRLSENDVRWAIETRAQGAMTWTTIGKKLGFPMQTIQTRIWRYLYATGQLTLPVVRNIWQPTTSERGRLPSWQWLENSTGYVVRV